MMTFIFIYIRDNIKFVESWTDGYEVKESKMKIVYYNFCNILKEELTKEIENLKKKHENLK